MLPKKLTPLFTSKIKNFLLDLFFPKSCLGCKQPDTYLCRDCFHKIPCATNYACFFCGKITGQGRICIRCQREMQLNRLIVASEYNHQLVQDLIRAFKYHYVRELAEPLSQIIIRTIEENLNNAKIFKNSDFLIVPVPLAGPRLRYRGFNQAELIAENLAEHFQLDIEKSALKRKTSHLPQAKIQNPQLRKLNIQDNFFAGKNIAAIKNKIVLLIDDVATTGATLSESAKVLKQNGAKEVWGIVIAKG